MPLAFSSLIMAKSSRSDCENSSWISVAFLLSYSGPARFQTCFFHMVHGNEHDDSRDKHKSEYHAEPCILFFLKAHAFFPLFFHLPDISTLLKPSDEAIEAYTLFPIFQHIIPPICGKFVTKRCPPQNRTFFPGQKPVAVAKKCLCGKIFLEEAEVLARKKRRPI